MRKLKVFYALLAVLLFLSVPLFSEVCYTDAEQAELIAIFDELESINRERLTQVQTLQTDLMISKTAQTRLNRELTGAQSSLQEVRNSLAEERKANRVKVLAATGIGIVIGLVIGLLLS